MTGAENSPRGEPVGLREAVIEYCGLQASEIADIEIGMEALGVGFGEAARGLGLVAGKQLLAVLQQLSKKDVSRWPAALPLRSVPAIDSAVTRRGAPVRRAAALIGDDLTIGRRGDLMRELRGEVQRRLGEHGGAIAIVSPAKGEGRSRLAADLAIAFAVVGIETLLIDADLRSCGQQRLFVTDRPWSWTLPAAAIGPDELRPVADVPHLSVVIAAAPATSALDVVSGPLFENMIHNCRRTHHVVLIDTPSFAECSDGLAVARTAEHALLAVRAGHTSFNELEECRRRLHSSGVDIVGSVLNHF